MQLTELTLFLTILPQDILSYLWKYKKAISEGSRLKGLQCVSEGYIQNVKLTQQQKHIKKITIKTKAHCHMTGALQTL